MTPKVQKKMICPVDKVECSTGKCGMVFHMTDAKKMLPSVDRMVEAGNEVKFGPGPGECFVKNIRTGRKITMEKDIGVYVLKVTVDAGGKQVPSTIVVDSGAAECVMPRGWFPGVEAWPAKEGLRFAGANGADLGNYGQKLIEFTPFGGLA